MGAATAMAAAAATAATLDAAFCAEQDTTATGACIERGSGVGWGTGQRREWGKGDARWGWSEREELDETRSNLHPIPRGASGASGARSCRARVRRSCRAGSDVFPGSWRVRTLAATLAWALMPVDILEESLA
jgi:hypothetical protein